uniref:transcription factor bHLH90-like n=1 Tax=Erigeron canadensis TaxID=72917 RepID=UPI001CB9CB6C|nr:transcription factor bHLH90-like [Erigeron canadensis]
MALELLRPFVETKSWDYCIVWQFGDDPSRYIKWVGCCCIGSKGVCKNVKQEIDHHHSSQLCRDTYTKHSLYTNACQKLAMLPFHLPLYSGIHGEVAMSTQPSWNHDSVGTQVLIPVDGGLIELYGLKQVPKDEEMIETIMAHFNIFPQQIMVHLKTEGIVNASNSSLVSVGSTQVSPTQSIDKPKPRKKKGQEELQSKHVSAEQSRRNRIKDGLFTLRALVPKITKLDRVSILGDAAEYIKELQINVQLLEDEVKRLDDAAAAADDDSKSHLDEVEVCKPKISSYQQHSTLKGHSRRSTSSCRKPEVEVEVHQIGPKHFLVKLTCGQKRGAFQRLMEILNSLGLQVLDVNVTTCYGRVLNVLKVEAKEKGVAAMSLREVLLHSWMSSILLENPTRSG